MVKIQGIKRRNGSVVHVITLTKEAIEESGLKKGDDVKVIADGLGSIRIKKKILGVD